MHKEDKPYTLYEEIPTSFLVPLEAQEPSVVLLWSDVIKMLMEMI